VFWRITEQDMVLADSRTDQDRVLDDSSDWAGEASGGFIGQERKGYWGTHWTRQDRVLEVSLDR
jgi:hypothetical protein